ncbi:hypothetical protein OS493_004632 [Desmophyllum pertusum]|uniref:Uncharacterized protein n=1 Tax=Desmophyllum pertusum TaxID=174260 RepID=A0A9W9ZGC9_9CNID|nr:hypothetical protein OS493_004632 [Desmophyllum pertusum]
MTWRKVLTIPDESQNRKEPTKSGVTSIRKEDCADGIRAWHWYHFENCAECGRLLQGKESFLETVDINIDGVPVTVKCSLPSSRPSFHHVLEYLKGTGSKDWTAAVGSAPTLPYWIFHPSHRDDLWTIRGLQIHLGKSACHHSVADTLPNCELGPSEGGVGYTRLFIQKMAFSLNLEYVFVIDDNVAVMYEAVFNTGDTTATEGRVLRHENGVMKMQRCSFLKPLTHLQKIAEGKDIPPIDESKYEPHPLKDAFESQEFPLYNYTGPAKLFGDKKHNSYGVLGLLRSVPIAVNPFSKTQVYAAILLNVKSTVKKGVFYRPWPCWEDLRFNDDCDKAGLEKCFKGSIGYDRQEESDDTISPTRIVEQLEQVKASDGTVENPVQIISYCAANRMTYNMLLLSSTFCSTKEKIVFVTSAKEAIERWPQTTVRNISTHNGICFTTEMSDRNTQFAIFSAADPKRHSLRWILIEASFLPPQDNKDHQEEIITTRDEHVSQNENEPKVEESTSSDRVQDISNGKKGVKRSLQQCLNEIKRRKNRRLLQSTTRRHITRYK